MADDASVDSSVARLQAAAAVAESEENKPPVRKKKEPVNVLKALRIIFVGKKKTPKELEREEIINRQKMYEMFEINETWRFVFGTEKPKKYNDRIDIANVTLRRIWMEEGFIFNEIKTHKPDEIFHDTDKYCFLWKPPGSDYRVCVPLNSQPLLEEALTRYSTLSPPSKLTVTFHFCCIDQTIPMFAPKVHPASLVSFKQRNEVLQKLCDLFLEGVIPLVDLNNVMECGFDTWKITLYNYLPPDWQPFHRYLSKDTVKTVEKSPESMYMSDVIDLQEYHDMKFPERARLRLMEKATYPLPYETEQCIICHKDDCGIIRCQNCDNKVCIDCVNRCFLDDKTKEGAFLLMHRRYCMHMGLFPNVLVPPLPEPAYIRNIRASGSARAYKELYIEPEPEEKEEEDEDDGIDEDEEERRRLAELAALNRIEVEVEDLRVTYDKRDHRYNHLEKDILDNQAHLDEPGHGDPYIERMNRLNKEAFTKVKKLAKQLDHLLEECDECEVELMEKIGRANGVESLREEVKHLRWKCDVLVAIESVQSYKDTLNPPEPEEPPPPDTADLLASFG